MSDLIGRRVTLLQQDKDKLPLVHSQGQLVEVSKNGKTVRVAWDGYGKTWQKRSQVSWSITAEDYDDLVKQLDDLKKQLAALKKKSAPASPK